MEEPQLKKTWKYYIGMTFLVLSIVLPLLGLVVTKFNLPGVLKAIVMGSMMIGGPELMIILAVLFLGKDTVKYFKGKFFALFNKEPMKHKPVSKVRYYIGLMIFLGSIIPLYLNGYFPEVLPKDKDLRLLLLASMDLLFVCSFFILGGDFWEKFKSLLIWDDSSKREPLDK